jgi:hypothetical protein
VNSTTQAEATAFMRELRRHHLERTFVHQFRAMATPETVPSRPATRRRRGEGGRGAIWRSFLIRPRRQPGLAAAKHAEQQQRRRELADAWRWRRQMLQDRRDAAKAKAGENRIAPTRRSMRGRPMTRWELYYWHRQNGTLELFYAMFRNG